MLPNSEQRTMAMKRGNQDTASPVIVRKVIKLYNAFVWDRRVGDQVSWSS